MRVLEGFYVEARGDIYAVKGVLHPQGKAVAVPAYIRAGSGYVRIRGLREGLSYLKEKAPDYLEWFGFAGQVLPVVPVEDVERVYDPLNPPKPCGEVGEEASRLKHVLEDEAGVEVGITGSLLLGLGSPDSDIDLVVYGLRGGERFYRALMRLRRDGILKPVSGDSWVRRSRPDSEISPETWLKLEERKFLTGLYRGRLYTAKIVPLPEEYWESLEQRVRELGRARIICEVMEDRFAKTTPNMYRVKVFGVMDGGERAWRVEALMSMRSRFAELARRGDLVEAEGRLEEVEFRGRKTVRLFLGNDPRDRLIPK